MLIILFAHKWWRMLNDWTINVDPESVSCRTLKLSASIRYASTIICNHIHNDMNISGKLNHKFLFMSFPWSSTYLVMQALNKNTHARTNTKVSQGIPCESWEATKSHSLFLSSRLPCEVCPTLLSHLKKGVRLRLTKCIRLEWSWWYVHTLKWRASMLRYLLAFDHISDLPCCFCHSRHSSTKDMKHVYVSKSGPQFLLILPFSVKSTKTVF